MKEKKEEEKPQSIRFNIKKKKKAGVDDELADMYEETNPPKEYPVDDNEPASPSKNEEEPKGKKYSTLRSFRLSLRKKKADKIFDEPISISSPLPNKKSKEEP